MGKKYIKWLYGELPKLVNKGILSAQSAEQLRQHYGSVEGRSRQWLALIICGIFGALLIGLGIILLLAHNWEALSRLVRTILSLLPLIAAQLLGGWVMWKRGESVAWKEGVATFITMMVGASIALVGQTYHIPGDIGDLLLCWMLLCIPLVYLMGVSIPAILYLIGITAWAFYAQYDSLQVMLFWPLVALVIPHFQQALKKELYTIRSIILSWTISICLCLGAGATLGRVWPGSWIVIYASLFAVLYLIGSFWFGEAKTDWQRPFRRVGAVGIFGLSFLLTFKWPWEEIRWNYYSFGRETYGPAAIVEQIIALVLIASALSLVVTCLRRGRRQKLLFGAIPVMAIIGYSVSGLGTTIILPTILFNLYVFVLSVSRIAAGIRSMHLGVLNIGMLMLAALIMARFFDTGFGFVTRGIAFIIIGIGFLMTNIVIMRRKGGAK